MMMNMTSSSKDKLDYIWTTYGIPNRFAAASFTNYYPTCASQESARKVCLNYARNDEAIFKYGKGLFLQGPVGTGKTHLSVATLRAIVESNIDTFGCRSSENPIYGDKEYGGYSCAMISTAELLELFRQSSSAKKLKHAAVELHRLAKISEIIILDDIGIEYPSDWSQELLFSIIDLRYRMQRATILTSNCALKDLEERLGKRIVSRVFQMCEGVKVEGEDYRKGAPSVLPL
ncbi:MAG: ATP-binding protein [Clostridiaceae bacterium]|nr:ATP-binding protein [Clostridiaceae bacterium]